ncbi:MAG: sulfite exporter TauE/SafE family protein [Rhizobiales bacterium]|nr:sulfite exporter TauE/SafE family protein [Hyphomicrobiales bacterium]NRB14405.1 sulfite exporter TauE/SafE family protein [Hyphomicrobiales bacterium]
MHIYLPIAEISVNLLLLLAIGGGIGFLSGLFGVGGGFLLTPLLIFTGIPPAVAVASGATQIVASSLSGVMAHFRRRTVDFKMGGVLLVGGVFGSFLGVALFSWLKSLGQADLLISISYVLFLGIIGGLMLIESVRAMWRIRQGTAPPSRRPGSHNWVHKMPFKMRFRASHLYISAIPPLIIGLLVGVLASIMGVGGGFIMIPAMIYVLKMPTNVVVGTSLFQIMFVTALVTILHSGQNQTVDVVLATISLIGGVVGAQFGVRFSQRLKPELLRALLAAMVMLVCLKIGYDLVVQPEELFQLMPLNRVE